MRNPLFLTKTDRKAVIALSIVAIISIGGLILFGSEDTPYTDNKTSPPPTPSRYPYQKSNNPQTPATIRENAPNMAHPPMHIFDPNTIDSASLVKMGISPRRVHTFIRYRNAGAVFRKPLDITRCYSLSDDDIDRLLPYIKIDPQYSRQTSYKRERYPIPTNTNHDQEASNTYSHQQYTENNKFTTLTKVNVNTADTTLLMRIPGIGQVISSMILTLRERLGGFISVNQLQSIKYMTPDLLEWFYVEDNPPVRTININTASFKTLVTHPYINKSQANAILTYVRLYGTIPDIATLSSTNIFTPEELKAISPYLEY